MHVDKNAVHFLRLKLLEVLKDIRYKTKLIGQIEGDECIRETKLEKMSRFSKPRQSKGKPTRV